MASYLSADAPAFNPASGCVTSGGSDGSDDAATAEAAVASAVDHSKHSASQTQSIASPDGVSVDGSDWSVTADAGDQLQQPAAAQQPPKPLAAADGSGGRTARLNGRRLPAYMVNCYPFVQLPPALPHTEVGNDIIADATIVSPRSMEDGGSLDYHYHPSAKGATSSEWLLAHSAVSMGGYAYAAAAPPTFVGTHAAVNPPVMQLYGGSPGAWSAVPASASCSSGSSYHVYPALAAAAAAAHTGQPFRAAAGESGRSMRSGAHRGGGRAGGGGRRGARWSGAQVASRREGNNRTWNGPSDESAVAAAADSPSARHNQHPGRWRRADDAMHADGSAGRNGWNQERLSPSQPKWGTASVGTQNESNGPQAVASGRSRPRTQIVKDACSQTDLADNIANLTLEEKPSSFYVGPVTGTAAAARGRSVQPRTNSIMHDTDSGFRRATSEAGVGTSPVASGAWSRKGGRTASPLAADALDGDHSPLRHSDEVLSSRGLRCDPTDTRGGIGTAKSTAVRTEGSRHAGYDRAAQLLISSDDCGSSCSRQQSPAFAAANPARAANLRTAAAGRGQVPTGESSSLGGTSESFAIVGDAVATETNRKRRCRRGPRKSKAAAAAAAVLTSAAVDAGESLGSSGEEEKDTKAAPDRVNQLIDSESQRRLLSDVVKSQPHAVSRHVAAAASVGMRPGDCGRSAASDSREDNRAAAAAAATLSAIATTSSVASHGLQLVDRSGDLSSTAAAAGGTQSYSQALRKATQPPSAAPSPDLRPPVVPHTAWAAKVTQLGNKSRHAGIDVEKTDDDGFLFNSVSYASRAGTSVTSLERRPNSGSGARGGAKSVSSVGDRSVTLTSMAAADAAGESVDAFSSPTGANGSRRQKKAANARLAAAEEQMEISLEQQVLRGQISRLSAAPANDASRKQPQAAPSASGKKSRQAISLNLLDLITSAAVNKKKEATLRDEAQARKPGDLAKRGGVGSGKSLSAASAPNALDSTAPTIKRGKEREKPKVKRPSALKKVILKERQDRKQSRGEDAAAVTAGALATSSDGQQSAGSGDLLSSNCGRSDDIGQHGRGAGDTVPTSSSDGSGRHGLDDDLIVNMEVAERQQSLDASFESALALSTPGGASGRLSSRSGDAFTPASQASMPLSPISQSSPISVDALSPESSPFASDAGTPVRPVDVAKEIQLQLEIAHKIHSRRFREYCDQLLDRDIDDSCTKLLQELVRFQERLFARDPVKAKARRRLVLGLREVTKHLRLRKIKLVIVSPNVERIQSKGGLDDALSTVVALCREQTVPLVFALGRKALGRACGKLVPVSVVGVFMYDGAEIHYRRLMELTQKARDGYEDMVKLVAKEAADERQRLAAAAAGCCSPPISQPAFVSSAVTITVGDQQPYQASGSAGGGSASSDRWPTKSQQPQASSQPTVPAAAQPIGVVRTVSSGKDDVSNHVTDHCAASHNLQTVAIAKDNSDDADEEALRRQNFEFDGDAGNEADVEDSLQESAAVPGYYRLLNGDGGKEAETALPTLPVSARPPVTRKPSSHDPAMARSAAADAESDGSTALAASATVTCSSSRSSGGSSDSSSIGSDTSTTGPGGNGKKRIKGSRSKSSRSKSSRSKGSRADGFEQSGAAASQPLPPDIRERVESWVAVHAAAAAASAAVNEAAAPIIADPLDADDVAEFTATLSACTANSDALLLGAVGGGGP